MIIAKRPGVERYLNNLNSIGNLHLYTSASRDYAIRVLKEIDPSNRLFGSRIIAQDSQANEVPKTLNPYLEQRHHLVVILDDQ
jgi:RNA polymerase II subunit A-like phosphatase